MTQGELCWSVRRYTTPVCLEWPKFGHKCPSDNKANIINHLMGVFDSQSVLNFVHSGIINLQKGDNQKY